MFFDPFEDLIDEIEKVRRRIKRFTEGLRFPAFEEVFPVDVYEENEEVIIRADLPGFEKDEIAIRVLDDSIDIRASHRKKFEERREGFYRAERRVGAMRRSFTLPAIVDPNTAKAKLEKGVLEIRIKKKAEKKGKEIKIE